MAGDWLKMRHDLLDDPAVIRLASACGLDEDAVLGKLFRLWVWADKHTTDGHADGLGTAWVDRTAKCEGFAAQMRLVGWLEDTGKGLSFPRFDRHCSAPAKARALTKNRVQKHRNAASVTGALPEKRREEKSNNTHTPAAEIHHFGEAGWADVAWERFAELWNRTERAEPWRHLTAPGGWVDLAASPGWVERAETALTMLPACTFFETPLPFTRFVEYLDRILAGEFRGTTKGGRKKAVGGNL